MRRVITAAVALGLLNALTAGVTVGVARSWRDDVGWFAYAPLNPGAAPPTSGFPWEYVLLPIMLVALNAGLAAVALRRGWLTRGGPSSAAPHR